MSRYTFTTTSSSTQFTANDDIEAAQIADQLAITFCSPKSECTLKRIPSSVTPNQWPQPWKAVVPSGPCVSIPVFIKGLWYTPNGGRIFDITAYKKRVIANHQSKSV